MKRVALFLLTSIFGFTSPASAHFLWIETECGRAPECRGKIAFGEYPLVREKNPGRLAERSDVRAQLVSPASGAAPSFLSTTVATNEIEVTFRRPPKEDGLASLAAVDDTGPVADLSAHQIGIVRPVFYTRAFLNPSRNSQPLSDETLRKLHLLPLDIVPLDSEGALRTEFSAGERAGFRIYMNGRPLAARAKIFIAAPNGWLWEGSAEKDGTVSFVPEWRGMYVIDVVVREGAPGVFKGEKFEAIRHRATLAVDAR